MSELIRSSSKPFSIPSAQNSIHWKDPLWIWGVVLVLTGLVAVIFYDGLLYMEKKWRVLEEYSYGYMIPVIALFLIWQRKNVLRNIEFNGSYCGCALVVFGLVGCYVGELSTLYTLMQYSFLLVVYGLFLAYMGWSGYKKIAIPLFILLFMIPLPNFIYKNLSAELQLISSAIGVWFIRIFDISVFLEGNVIDLGALKLQVVEACSGLRYLFPLMTIAFILSYFYQAPLWKRVLLFLSSIPITVGMNSFRIGVIGYTVEHWGKAAAEGFIHDFEGWIVFMSSMVVMLFFAWLLNLVGKNRQPLLDVLSIYLPEPVDKSLPTKERLLPKPFIASICIIAVAALYSSFIPEREEIIPNRMHFESFPLALNEWRGAPDILESKYIKVLKLSDYIMANYSNRTSGEAVNFYVAYYDSQRKGASVHSPRSCLPGGGWKINESNVARIDGAKFHGFPVDVNRVLMTQGDEKKLVYYWFQQRGRIMTNEFAVKWFLFWDAITKNRTDGALVRLITDVNSGESIQAADKALTGFLIDALDNNLEGYIPE